MIDCISPELEALAREAATQVAGDGGIEQLAVEEDCDYDGTPTYRFTLLVNEGRAKLPIGLLKLRLSLRLRDELLARGDEHHPRLTLLDKADWERLRVA